MSGKEFETRLLRNFEEMDLVQSVMAVWFSELLYVSKPPAMVLAFSSFFPPPKN